MAKKYKLKICNRLYQTLN